jgi:hypothetical protein
MIWRNLLAYITFFGNKMEIEYMKLGGLAIDTGYCNKKRCL